MKKSTKNIKKMWKKMKQKAEVYMLREKDNIKFFQHTFVDLDIDSKKKKKYQQ